MKKSLFNITCLGLLIPALLFCSLPVSPVEDVSRNGHAGLEEVILSVRSLADSAGGDASFRSGMSGAVSSLTIAAGLKTVIKPAKELAASVSVQWVFLLMFSGLIFFQVCFLGFLRKNDVCKSHIVLPELPPPRFLQFG